MRAILSFVFLICTTLFSFAQTPISKIDHASFNEWQHPIIKQLQAKDPNLIAYGIKDKWVNIAIVDKKEKIIYYFNCVGFLKDITPLSDFTYNRFVTKQEDPFQYYNRLIKDGIELRDAAIEKFRYPKTKAYYKGIPEYDSYVKTELHHPQFDTLKTDLEKLAWLYNKRQFDIYSTYRAIAKAPNKVTADTLYTKQLSNIKQGEIKLSEHTDSTGVAEFYNKNLYSPIYKATLNIATSKIYFYHLNQSVFDSLSVNRKKVMPLINEGTNIFTLYQNYNLWRLMSLDDVVKQMYDYHNKKNISSKQKKGSRGNACYLWR